MPQSEISNDKWDNIWLQKEADMVIDDLDEWKNTKKHKHFSPDLHKKEPFR